MVGDQLTRRTAEATAAPADYDAAPFGGFHLRVAIASTGGVFADGFGLGIIGIALSRAAPLLGLDAVWLGLLGGASLAGLFLGALLTGPAADHLGRRAIYAGNMPLTAALAAAQFLVTGAAQLLVLRLAIGFLLGTDYVVSKALLSEYLPRRFRGRLLGLLSIAWAGGYACAYAVGVTLSALPVDAWRWMLLTSAAPCLLIAPLRITIPESPLWLASHGQAERAAHVVLSRFGPGVRPPPAAAGNPAREGRWRQLLSGRWRIRTLVACTFFACQVIPYFAVGTFVTQLMAALHLQGALMGGLIYNAALLAGAMGGVAAINRISRRSFLVGSFSAAALALFALSIAPGLNAAAMIVLFAIFAGVVSAASNLVYVYIPELFPTDLRASGIGLAVAASRIGSAAGTFVLPVMVSAYGVRSALGACVAVLVLGGWVCFRWAPETRHLSFATLDQPA
ncbi:MAG: MFS transporter [Gammaproteobacteria bacterium]|nr:MFS transporter [Gammaproteobacteria bacterium]